MIMNIIINALTSYISSLACCDWILLYAFSISPEFWKKIVFVTNPTFIISKHVCYVNSDRDEFLLCPVSGHGVLWKMSFDWWIILNIKPFGDVSNGVFLEHFCTWQICRRCCRGWEFLLNGSLLCGVLSELARPPFHKLCTHLLFLF